MGDRSRSSEFSENPSPIQILKANSIYFRTGPGIRKICEIILAILVLVCVGSVGERTYQGDGVVYATAGTALIFCAISLLFFAFQFEILQNFGCKITFLTFEVLLALFYVVSFVICCVAAAHYCKKSKIFTSGTKNLLRSRCFKNFCLI